jgi:hypothetical protein
MRYLFLLLVVVGAVMVWRRWLSRSSRHGDSVGPKEGVSGTMVQCRVCGIYLPEEESLTADQFHYCSIAHREQDTQRQP